MATKAEQVEGGDGELLLKFYTKRPLPAADLGNIFQTIAEDYRRFSKGRELVVYQLAEGSLLAVLRDAVEWIGGVNSVIEFGKTLVGLFRSLKSDQPLPSKRTPGLRTIENLSKIASKTSSRVRFSYRRSFLKGEEMSFQIEPGQAPEIEGRALQARRVPQRKSARIARLDPAAATLELTHLGRSGGNADLLVTIARALVSAGAGHLVLEIARRLEAEGHLEAARQLKRATSVMSDRKDPPLLT